MKKILLLLILIFSYSGIYAQNDSIYFWKSGVLLEMRSIKSVDLDSITFKRPEPIVIPQVTICSQVWATRNLDVSTYSDGTPIPQVTSPSDWQSITTGAWCYYNNDPANNAEYGKLYNWYAAAGIYDSASLDDPALRKNLAPTGWHVPTDGEWSVMINCHDPNANGGGNTPNIAGGQMKEVGISHWLSPNTGATNSYGFTGLPGGYRYNNGPFVFIGTHAIFWSSSQDGGGYAWYRTLYHSTSDTYRTSDVKTLGCSVRYLKD